MKDVIVTGGRDYQDDVTVKRVLDLFDIGLLIEGGARGADELARQYAAERGIQRETVHAEWTKNGRGAGPIRNREMLERYPNAIVIAFPGGRGTENCVSQAVLLGRTVLRVAS